MKSSLILNVVLLTAVCSAGSSALAEGPRWTPLTGLLVPEGASEPGMKMSIPTETSSTQKPEAPAAREALAAHSLKAVLENVVTDGRMHGGLGVGTVAIDADLAAALDLGSARGALVTDAGSRAAASAGIRVGDIIQKIDRRTVSDPAALARELLSFRPDQQVTIDIRRAGDGATDLKRLLVERADAGNVAAAASLGRLLALGHVFGSKHYAEAATYYLKAAEAGHAASMTRYALFAKDGAGIPKDEALAAEWFRKAAEAGQDAAMTNLGSLYEAGRGVEADLTEAARWYRAAVSKGDRFAMHRLALLYEAGRGVPKDDREAIRLLNQASEQGLSEATSWLAEKYELGRGIAKDEAEAKRLNARAAEQVRHAANQGDAVATFNLGILYRTGRGVERSDTEATYWVLRSLRLGDAYLVSELMRNPDLLTSADRKWLQELLRNEGTYSGPINGTFSPEMRTAMEALASRA